MASGVPASDASSDRQPPRGSLARAAREDVGRRELVGRGDVSGQHALPVESRPRSTAISTAGIGP